MDEHSQSVIQAAARAGVTPQAWVDRMADDLRRLLAAACSCSHDDWIRTTEPRHIRAVTALLRAHPGAPPGRSVRGRVRGAVLHRLRGVQAGGQIVDGHCVEHPDARSRVPTKERNHFFRLSAYRDRLLAAASRAGDFAVEPAIRRNEVLRLLEGGLQDISISRQRLPWGIPFPGDPQQTVYVWFDALINYLSATGFPDAGFERLWPADLHVDRQRDHAVPLRRSGPRCCSPPELALPRRVWAHGYVQWGGAKMSKTAGTAVSLDDGDRASRRRMRCATSCCARSDSRTTAISAGSASTRATRRRSRRHVRQPRVAHAVDGAALPRRRGAAGSGRLRDSARGRRARDPGRATRATMDALAIEGGAAQLIALATRANRYVEETAPWKLAKAQRDAELDTRARQPGAHGRPAGRPGAALHAGEGRATLGGARQRPAARRGAVRRRSRRSTPPDGAVRKLPTALPEGPAPRATSVPRHCVTWLTFPGVDAGRATEVYFWLP